MNITIITHSHLCRNPRVVKEAVSLSQAGYRVTILTTWTDAELLAEDYQLIDSGHIRYVAAENIIPGGSSVWRRFVTRLRRRLAGEFVRLFGIQTVHALGYSFRKNLRKAMSLKADLYICHQELPTIIGCKLIKKGFAVAFDFEDWYSHDLLPEARRTRPVRLLEKYEKFALRHGVLAYTTSQAMAEALGRFAGSRAPEVLCNVFPNEDRKTIDGQRKDRTDFDRLSLHWFSQTLGPGRGLEELAEALNQVEQPYELHLRGNCSQDYRAHINLIFRPGKNQQVLIHPLVSHNELLSRIAEHDIGLALEKNIPESRDLTITNKILQYLQGGLVVLASDTAGQKEVAAIAGESVHLFQNENVPDMFSGIVSLMNNKTGLALAKERAVRISKETLCWEEEEKKLLGWISKMELIKS